MSLQNVTPQAHVLYDNEVLELVKQYGTYVISGNREQYLVGFMKNNNYNSNYIT